MEQSHFNAFLCMLIDESGLSKTELANRAGISRSSLYNFISGDVGECKLSTLVAISAALRVHPLEVIQPYLRLAKSPGNRELGTEFVEDVTYPDYSIVMPNQRFTKIWSVFNSGATAWQDLYLSCQDEPMVQGDHTVGLHPVECIVPIPYTPANQRVEIAVELIAPSLPCTVMSEWKTIDAHGNLVFPNKSPLYCLVKVCTF